MNPPDASQNQISEIVQKGMAGVIVLPINPSPDAVAAATAIYLGLTKLGKNITLACETNVKSDLTASDKIQSEMTTSGDNLVISFPYTDGSIDKVDYNIQGDVFNLIVTPRQGQPKLDPEKVKYSYAGGMIDFVITIDTPNLNSLGAIFQDNRKQFQGKTIINIDRHLVNDFYGTVNLVNKTSSSTSELALRFLRELDIEIDRDMATNLYAGLTGATNNFTSYSVNADTFDAAASLLKLGALKKQVKRPNAAPPMNQPQSFAQPPQNPQSTKPATPQHKPKVQVSASEHEVKPIEMVEQEDNDQEMDASQPGQDWLKPKIFRGSGLI